MKTTPNSHNTLMDVFAKHVEDGMDALWESGEWDNEKNENILKKHLRTACRTK